MKATAPNPNDIVVDPTSGRRMSIAPSKGGSIGLPYSLLVNPRDMKVPEIFQVTAPR